MDQLSPPNVDPMPHLVDRPPAPELLEHATHRIRLRGDDPCAFAVPAREHTPPAAGIRRAA